MRLRVRLRKIVRLEVSTTLVADFGIALCTNRAATYGVNVFCIVRHIDDWYNDE